MILPLLILYLFTFFFNTFNPLEFIFSFIFFGVISSLLFLFFFFFHFYYPENLNFLILFIKLLFYSYTVSPLFLTSAIVFILSEFVSFPSSLSLTLSLLSHPLSSLTLSLLHSLQDRLPNSCCALK